jgi:hypothetical protein
MKYSSLGGVGLWVCIMGSIAFGADIYVSPSGSDANDGSSGAPFATIERARAKADTVKSGGTVNVYLRKGTYYLSSTLTFGSSNSGNSASAPIIYQGYQSEKAIISGGIKVTSAWSSTTLNGVTVQTTNIGTNKHVDQLFLNGKRQIMARYPNFNANQMLEGYTSSSSVFSQVNSCASPQDGPGYIRTLHGSMWGGNDFYITGKGSGSGQPPWQWVGDNNRGNGYNTTYMMCENISELLDAAGEWYYKKSTGDLYFYPPSGTDMSTAIIELASLTQLIQFTGSSTSSTVKNIQFKNLIFTHTYRSLFDGTGQFYELVTKSDWGIVRKGTVFMQNADHITIDQCTFDQIGGNGVFMSGYNRNNVVSNCDFEDAGASCVCLFGLKSAWRCYNSWSGASCSDYTNAGPATNEYPANCRIDNNMMNHLGRFEKQTAGFTCSGTEFDTIRHNSIHNIPRAGINFCDGSWGGNLVDYNWVYDCIKESGDHGPFNAWGRDRIEMNSGNLAASKLDARNTTVIRMNRFEGPVGYFGIDLDDQATNYYQEKNLMIGGSNKLQWNRYNTYVNNISVLRGGGGTQFHGVWSSSNHYGARNILWGTLTCVYQTCCGTDCSNLRSVINQWDSNVVYSTAGTPNVSGWQAGTGCGSQTCNWSTWQNGGLDQHSSTADPGFVDTQKTWTRTPPYLPRGDFNPTNSNALTTLHFQTFAMDSFGVMGYVGAQTAVKGPWNRPEVSDITKAVAVLYYARRLTVSYDGDYQVAITSALGRTVATFKGKGRSSFVLDPKRTGSGIYFAAVHTKNGVVSRRFMVSK